MSEHDDDSPDKNDKWPDYLDPEEAKAIARKDPIRYEIWTFMYENWTGQNELRDQIRAYINGPYSHIADLLLDPEDFLLLACRKLLKWAWLSAESRNDGTIRKGYRRWIVCSEVDRQKRLTGVDRVTSISEELQLNIWAVICSDIWAEAQRLKLLDPIGEEGGLTNESELYAAVGRDSVSKGPRPAKKAESKTEVSDLPPREIMNVPGSPPLVGLSPQEVSAEFDERLASLDKLLKTVDEPDRTVFRRTIELRMLWSSGNEDAQSKKGREEKAHESMKIRRSLKTEFGFDSTAEKMASLRLDNWVNEVRVWEDAKRYRELGLSMDEAVSRITQYRFAKEYERELRSLIASGLTRDGVALKLAPEIERIRLRVASVCPAVLERWGDPAAQKTSGLPIK